jgi:hypothetical protein
MPDGLDVSHFNNDDVIAFGNTTYKVNVLQKAANKSLSNHLGMRLNSELQHRGITIPETVLKAGSKTEPYTSFFTSGIDCEVLQIGSQGWKKGKLRFKLSVEFVPDEPESVDMPSQNSDSSLDDIRQMINE